MMFSSGKDHRGFSPPPLIQCTLESQPLCPPQRRPCPLTPSTADLHPCLGPKNGDSGSFAVAQTKTGS